MARQPLNDLSNECLVAPAKHSDCPVLFQVHADIGDMAFGGIAVCDCECHNKRREEVIQYIEFLRDIFAGLDDNGDNSESIREELYLQCGNEWQNHAIDHLGDALTFLGYPNQPEE